MLYTIHWLAQCFSVGSFFVCCGCCFVFCAVVWRALRLQYAMRSYHTQAQCNYAIQRSLLAVAVDGKRRKQKWKAERSKKSTFTKTHTFFECTVHTLLHKNVTRKKNWIEPGRPEWFRFISHIIYSHYLSVGISLWRTSMKRLYTLHSYGLYNLITTTAA